MPFGVNGQLRGGSEGIADSRASKKAARFSTGDNSVQRCVLA